MGTCKHILAKEGEIIILSQIHSSTTEKLGFQTCFVYFLHVNIS